MRLIYWAIRNPVPVNLVMLMILVLGFASGRHIKRELFPKFQIDAIRVTVEIEGGSTPDQVDRNVIQIIQPTIQNIDGIKEIRSTATQNLATLEVELEGGYDPNIVRDEVKGKIDTIRTLPQEALDPRIEIIKFFERAIRIAVYGEGYTGLELRQITESIKTELKAEKIVSRAEIYSPRPMEVVVTVPQEVLQSKNLTIQEIAQEVKSYNIELTAGQIRAEHNNILLKGEGRRTTVDALAGIPIRFSSGEFTRLGDLAGKNGIRDGFSEDPVIQEFNGQPAVIIEVERGDDEDLIALCDRVKDYVASKTLPSGLQITAFRDLSLLVKDRLWLILKNGVAGLILVLLTLSLFLEWRIAFWVASGIAFSLVGALALLYVTGGTINMLTLFGFLMTTGIVVDDAIVVGENFFNHKRKGERGEEAAERALKEVSAPVLAMVSTTLVAFLPLLFVTGLMGEFIRIIPSVILCALSLSLLESLLILPSHLAHHSSKEATGFLWIIQYTFYPLIALSRRFQPSVNSGLERLAELTLIPTLRMALYHRYATAVLFFSLLLVLFGLIPAGIIKTALFPRPDAEFHEARIEFERGTPIDTTLNAARLVEKAFQDTGRFFEERDGDNPNRESFLDVGSKGSHQANLMIRLKSVDEGRSISGEEFVDTWRSFIPDIPNLLSINFTAQAGGPPSKPIELWLTSNDDKGLAQAERATMDYLKSIVGVVDVNTDNKPGALTAEITLKPEYQNLQNTEAELIRALASAYQGTKVDTFYRGDNEVKMWVRTAIEDRRSLYQMKQLQLEDGVRIGQIADLNLTREEAEIRRVDGNRTTTVNAEVDRSSGANAADIREKLERQFLSQFPERFPTVRWAYSGESKEGGEAMSSLLQGYLPAVFGIYLILATVFRSYFQPLIIMFAVPFAFVGSILGHFIMGLPINLLSLFGIVALTGVAVNDSLVLIDYINTRRRAQDSLEEALVAASRRRLRPIVLTSLTTIAGMSPILFETSYQAQYLIPMVTSIVFGVGTATLLILILIPVSYAILQDLLEATGKQKMEHALDP